MHYYIIINFIIQYYSTIGVIKKVEICFLYFCTTVVTDAVENALFKYYLIRFLINTNYVNIIIKIVFAFSSIFPRVHI